MKSLQEYFVLIITSFLLLVGINMATGSVLSKPEILYTEDTCGENEVYSQCQANPICQKTCNNIDNWDSVPCIQTKSCLSGCVCKVGYVRDKDQGICILENSCPRVRH
ncbi:venom peptide SjAPI-like [Ceratina calcarata]|uniref:Venom peptide SjAPI-like n=1 Tax=Ceratina calcarata TaxID=156304 RepID=A0AAJ7JIA4_9HYME|nr:venom peptide SjAPI-like [Ceratina calcarata]